MFHDGDLQSGITAAIQQSKIVACFVRDDSEASAIWEDNWIRNGNLKDLISQKAVLLRIQQGSQEAGFLEAFCPITRVPALIFIRNGQLVQHLANGIDRSIFDNDTEQTMSDTPPMVDASDAEPTAASDPPLAPTERDVPASFVNTPSSQPTAQPTVPSSAPPDNRAAIAEGKRKAVDAEVADPKKAGELSYAAQQRAKQAEARKERDRILRTIEADKQERKEKEERRRALAKAEAAKARGESEAPDAAQTQPSQQSSQPSQPTRPASSTCALQVRLFDGSTIRTHFEDPQTQTLSTAVRSWIDQHLTNTSSAPLPPYTFRQILSPHPNRTLSISEESESLQSLGLTPTATLVIVPIQGYSEAYSSAGATGLVSRGLAAGYGVASWGLGLVAGALGAVTGVGHAVPEPYVAGTEQEGPPNAKKAAQPGPVMEGRAEGRVRTLADQREREGKRQQFYNGNQVSFTRPWTSWWRSPNSR
ncbi:UBX domain-containing protein [Cryomyces antarcticus]